MHTTNFENLIIKGGYGENGRSCFLIKRENSYIMLDCGIMDPSLSPYPQIDSEILEKTSHIFASHAHKDHIGAFNYFVDHGFKGTLITTQITYDYAKLEYKNTYFLEEYLNYFKSNEIYIDKDFYFKFGKSGHCVGSVWFYLCVDEQTYFYSGDFQADTLVYHCDIPRNLHANIAIIDAAHMYTENAQTRRQVFIEKLQEELKSDKIVILPVQKFGRGIEILYQILKSEIDISRLKLDEQFITLTLQDLKYKEYFKDIEHAFIKKFLENYSSPKSYSIFLTNDTHIENKSTQNTLKDLDYTILCTGKVKKDGYIEKAIFNGKAVVTKYTHHQSYEDMNNIIPLNSFDKILPFHNTEKKIL